ncbi:MAG: M48 family metallopeptidase [Spirochaetales bacterium]|nr:M48 family metallopeptidase [Spirochaetales bacterium]
MAKKTLPSTAASDPVAYEVIRRKGQKHINIRVHHDGRVTVSAPANASEERVREALKAKQKWIRSHVERTLEKRGNFDELAEIPLAGVPHRISIDYLPDRKGSIRLVPEIRTINLRTASTSRATRIKEMAAFLKRYCVGNIKPEVESMAKLAEISINSISFRNQKARWGSSSARGTISLNFRIALLPPEKRRYLIIHELAHQVHMNHSPAFWNYVALRVPDYAECDSWLREHSFLLGIFR